MTTVEEMEDILVERLRLQNGWDLDSEDYGLAVDEVRWFLSQPEIILKGTSNG